jgi:hypothetical protein
VNEGEKVDYSLFLHHTLWYPSLSFVSLKSQTIPIGMLSFMNTSILVHRRLYSLRIHMSACHFLLRSGCDLLVWHLSYKLQFIHICIQPICLQDDKGGCRCVTTVLFAVAEAEQC